MESRSLRRFWRDVLTIHGSTLPHVLPRALVFGGCALLVCLLVWFVEWQWTVRLDLAAHPFEYIGTVLGLLLVLRTNAGYERWWEGRKLWGGIVNQARNLAISGLAYGPADPRWRQQFIRWASAFPHVARASLREQPPGPELAPLLGTEAAARVAASEHMPSLVALALAEQLRDAMDRFSMDGDRFRQVDRERALLIDHIGGCERIKKSPLPRVYKVSIRRFLALFLLALPFSLLHKMDDWVVPFVTVLIAYPVLSLDQIGVELENPFSAANLDHLPLDDITATIQRNLAALEKGCEAEA
jgi:ion channel-forming bestrophin family protein